MPASKKGVALILVGSKGSKGMDEDAMEGLGAAYDEYTEAVKSGDKKAGMRALKAFVQMAHDDD